MTFNLLKNKNNIFFLVTIVLLVFDVLFVWVSYHAAQETLNKNLSQRGEQLRHTYEYSLEQLSNFMLQNATYIANNKEVSQLFYQGKLAVNNEGGGAGGERAAKIRSQLNDVVERGWNSLKDDYTVRQLHFHLPIDTSFLRVHRPDKFGDDLTEIRHSVVAVNTQQIMASGFESGRVYGGIRGVVPVYAEDEETGEFVHVGALEAGTSFNRMLDDLKQEFSAEFAVLMTLEHAEETMWPDFLKNYLKNKIVIKDFLLEASTNESQAEAILLKGNTSTLLDISSTALITLDDTPVAVTSFPLRDYLGTVQPDRNDIGQILVWTSAKEEVTKFYQDLKTNIFVAILSFLVIESILFWAIRMESKLKLQKEISLRDGLTGIYNRRAFDEQFQQEFLRAKRGANYLSVILCDIDHFKKYNDHYGHIAGDKCIESVAQTLTTTMKRSSDFVARYGGEEFVIVLPATDKQNSAKIAERIRAQIESLQIEHVFNTTSNVVTISCGAATIKFDSYLDTASAKELLNRADKALYEAKGMGRNAVCSG